MLAASLNAFFCASPIYGSADDFTSLLNFTPCKNVTPAAKQQVGETRKKLLAQRPAFFRFDISSGIIKGEQPLIRASRASKVAGAFLVLFWHAKENLALPKERSIPRLKRAKPFIRKLTYTKIPPILGVPASGVPINYSNSPSGRQMSAFGTFSHEKSLMRLSGVRGAGSSCKP